MACQHSLFSSEEKRRESRIALPWGRPSETWFRPIVDTFERRILAHQCLSPLSESQLLAIRSAAKQAGRGLYFVDLAAPSVDDPGFDVSGTIEAVVDAGLEPENLVFQMAECNLTRDPGESHRIRDYLRSRGFGFALAHAGTGAGAYSLQAARDFAPDYINLDPRLMRNFNAPTCAPTIGRLVQLAERSGARVIAEGVDRVRMVENLWLLGVRFMQGHLFGDPSPPIA
jgi:EAL domain-containing protein (putative c-di-GMP-specific phosphodiesterase class I)